MIKNNKKEYQPRVKKQNKKQIQKKTKLLEDLYEVEKIINDKYVGGEHLFFVKWVGYSSNDNTWVKINLFFYIITKTDSNCLLIF